MHRKNVETGVRRKLVQDVNPLQTWAKRVGWEKRVKAVCKPCWELKYCPYGPLVEEFPLQAEPDYRSCRIFGHDCPVFHVAEPVTETKELRNISRRIPRPVQFRVLKRENQICSDCGKSVQDDDIHFDHIIPHSKGGSSDEHNVRLLCSKCNIRRSDRYEAEHLVAGVFEHVQQPLPIDFLELLVAAFSFAQGFRKEQGRFPSPDEVAKEFAAGKRTLLEERLCEMMNELDKFFAGKKPEEMTGNQFNALATRWGYADGDLYNLKDVAEKFHERITDLVLLERTLVSRAGWYLTDSKAVRAKWETY